jgi:hypothetical protein
MYSSPSFDYRFLCISIPSKKNKFVREFGAPRWKGTGSLQVSLDCGVPGVTSCSLVGGY